MFKPYEIYYEKAVEDYELGKELLEKYKDVPKKIIESHNNIEEMRKIENKEFLKFSIVHTKLFVIVFSKTKSLLLPISKVKFLSDFSAVFIIFSSICSLFTKSLKYAHLL